MRRAAELITAAALVAGLAACHGSTGQSNDPDEDGCAATSISATPERVAVGDVVTITGDPTGCRPGDDYRLTFTDFGGGRTEFTASADADGGFTTRFTIPDVTVGAAVVTLDTPYPPCNDTGSNDLFGAVSPLASCAAVQTIFQVDAPN